MSDWRDDYRPGTLVIWPTGPIADVANALRSTYSPTSQRSCAAHVTLTQPFLLPPDDAAWRTVRAIADTTPGFPIDVGPIETFGASGVLKFDIRPKSTILDLRRRLHATGLFNLSLPFTEGFIPHMTISEFGLEPQQARDLATQLNQAASTGTFDCAGFSYIRPDEAFVFHSLRNARFR